MRKIIAFITALIMCVGMSGMYVLADGDFLDSCISIDDGEQFSLSTAKSGNGWTYDGNLTLTLENFNGKKVYFCSSYEDKQNLTVVLKGNNTLSEGFVSADHADTEGLRYGVITFTGDGTLKTEYLAGGTYVVSAKEVTTKGTLGMRLRKLEVTTGAVANVIENSSGGSLNDDMVILNLCGGVLNIHNSQQSYFNVEKEKRIIKDGGVINLTSDYDYGALLLRYDSTAFSDYLITDADGNPTQLEPNPYGNISGAVVASATPTVPLKKLRISEFAIMSKGGNKVDLWAQSGINEVIDKGLMPECLKKADLTGNITRAEFASVAVKLFEKLGGTMPEMQSLPFADLGGLSEILYKDVQTAYSLGLINGVSATNFAPASPLTREQASTILFRIYTKLGGKADASDTSLFADDAGISAWAKDAVYFMASKGILNGVGNNNFAPKNNTQAQQALIIASRMINTLS